MSTPAGRKTRTDADANHGNQTARPRFAAAGVPALPEEEDIR